MNWHQQTQHMQNGQQRNDKPQVRILQRNAKDNFLQSPINLQMVQPDAEMLQVWSNGDRLVGPDGGITGI